MQGGGKGTKGAAQQRPALRFLLWVRLGPTTFEVPSGIRVQGSQPDAPGCKLSGFPGSLATTHGTPHPEAGWSALESSEVASWLTSNLDKRVWTGFLLLQDSGECGTCASGMPPHNGTRGAG